MDVREKLVELLSEKCMETCKQRKGYVCSVEECKRSKEKCCGFYADHLISNGVTVQEWIPASEPPKKITNKVTVLCKNGYIGYGHYEDYKGERTWYNLESGKPFTDWDLEDCESYEVTHWMPLPQPPKGE